MVDKVYVLLVILVIIVAIFAAILGSGVISQIFQNTDTLEKQMNLLIGLIESERKHNSQQMGNITDLRYYEEMSDRELISKSINISMGLEKSTKNIEDIIERNWNVSQENSEKLDKLLNSTQ